MYRSEFEKLRDLPGKKIISDIKFTKTKNTSPLLRAEDIMIENDAGSNCFWTSATTRT